MTVAALARDLWWVTRVTRAAARRAPDLHEILAPLAGAVERSEDLVALAAAILPHLASALDRRDADPDILLPVGRGWRLAHAAGAASAPSERDLAGILREYRWDREPACPDLWDGTLLAWYSDPDGDLYLLVGRPGREPLAVEIAGEAGRETVDAWVAAVRAGLALRADRVAVVRQAWDALREEERARAEEAGE